MESAADLQRAVLQSASASIAVPELELALSSGGGGGMATTAGELISNVSMRRGLGGWHEDVQRQAGVAAVCNCGCAVGWAAPL